MDQVANSFHINNLGKKIRKFIVRCDTCQRVKPTSPIRLNRESKCQQDREICVLWSCLELYQWQVEALDIYLCATCSPST